MTPSAGMAGAAERNTKPMCHRNIGDTNGRKLFRWVCSSNVDMYFGWWHGAKRFLCRRVDPAGVLFRDVAVLGFHIRSRGTHVLASLRVSDTKEQSSLQRNWILTAPRWMRQKAGTFPYPHWASILLDNPIRRTLESPAVTIDAIGLRGDENVLEVGPGPGFFSLELASRLSSGHLHLFDIQPEMLDKARRKLESAGYRSTGFHVGTAGADFPFPADVFDVAFLAEVIGEIPDRSACLRSLARVLKPHGKLVFREAFPDPDRLSVSELRALVEPHGFAFIDGHENRWRGIARFQRESLKQ